MFHRLLPLKESLANFNSGLSLGNCIGLKGNMPVLFCGGQMQSHCLAYRKQFFHLQLIEKKFVGKLLVWGEHYFFKGISVSLLASSRIVMVV